jgi:hypothetical protein
MKFNVNNLVRVKLTDHGKKILQNDAINLPKEDKDGWSEWQLWGLMSNFGQYLYNGCELPFEINIEFFEDTMI